MRSITVFMGLALLLVTACGKDGKDRPDIPLLYSPHAAIPGGVGMAQQIKLMPAGSPEVERGEAIAYPVVAGRQPVKLAIDNSPLIEVTKVACEKETCTIAYLQKTVGEIQKPMITYHVIDEAGSSWIAGTLTVNGQVPKLKQPRFIPSFGETIKLVMPLVDENGAGLQFAPKVINPVARAGELKSVSCSAESCTFEFLYNKHTEVPSISFTLEGSAYRAQQEMLPQGEEITFQSKDINVFGNPAILKLVQGVDYISSWKRPAASILVHEYKGMDRPWFNCSVDSCVSNIYLRDKASASLVYSITSALNRVQLGLTVIDPDVKALLTEVVVDHNTETRIKLSPGVDYSSVGGGLATALSLVPNYNGSGLTVKDASCDAKGVCSFTVLYNGTEAFVTKNYKLQVGNYTSPSMTLKIVPRIHASSETMELWNDKDFQELVLRPGTDYQTQDATKAMAIVVESSRGIQFRDTTDLNDTNRSTIFQCDADGNCRAWIRNTYTSILSARLIYAVQTSTGTSAEADRTVHFKTDEFKIPMAASLAKIQGRTLDERLDRVEFSLRYGLDYTSNFKADKLQFIFSGKNLSLDNATEVRASVWEVPCDEAGLCKVQGIVRADNGYLDMKLKLINSRGESAGFPVRLIRQQNASMLPNRSSITVSANDSETFDVTLEGGAGKGYDGDLRASRMQLQASGGELLNGNAVEGSTFVEYPCTDEGRCTFRIRAKSYSSRLKLRFVDAEGRSSILGDLTVVYPEFMALSTTLVVPAEVHKLSGNIPYSKIDAMTSLVFEAYPGIGIEVTPDTTGFKIELTLDQALTVEKSVKLAYRLKKGEQLSNSATITLEAFMPLSLKSDLVIPAKKEADGIYTVTLKYADHFNPLPQGRDHSFYFYDGLVLTLDKDPNILPGTLNCRYDTCTLSIVKVQGAVVPLIKAVLKYSKGYPITSHYMKDGHFTITFD